MDDILTMVLLIGALFILAAVIIGVVAALIIRSARRGDGSINWRRLGNGDL